QLIGVQSSGAAGQVRWRADKPGLSVSRFSHPLESQAHHYVTKASLININPATTKNTPIII
ncbi:hypothetical protein ACVGXC_00955, partial [Enterobacter hormaechei]